MGQPDVNAENLTKGKLARLPCESCAGDTNHAVRCSVDQERRSPEENVRDWESFQVVECAGCGRISFRRITWSTADVDYDDEGNPFIPGQQELYPARLADHKPLEHLYYLPLRVQRIYSEAHFALRNQQRILAAIGIRALVEAVCGEENARKGNLEARIDSLVDLGKLARDGAAILHGTRLLGNGAAHEVEPPTADDLLAAMQVAEHLLTTVYILPKVAARLPKPNPLKQGGP